MSILRTTLVTLFVVHALGGCSSASDGGDSGSALPGADGGRTPDAARETSTQGGGLDASRDSSTATDGGRADGAETSLMVKEGGATDAARESSTVDDGGAPDAANESSTGKDSGGPATPDSGGDDAAKIDAGATCTLGCPAGYTAGAQGVCGGGNASDFVLDEELTEVKGTVTLNGVAPTDNCTPTPGAYVVFARGGETFTAPLSSTFKIDVFVPAGTYVVSVEGDATCTNLPPGSVDVLPAFQVSGSSTSVTIDIAATEVQGTVTLNGGAPTNRCTPTPGAYVVFTHGSQTFTAPLTTTFGMDTFVPAGTYEVSVEGTGTCGNLPAGSTEVLPSLQVTSAPATVALNVVATEMKGTVTLNGGAPTNHCTPTPGAYVLFSSGAQTFTAPLSTAFGMDTFVPPGTYEVSVEGTGTCGNLPPGTSEVLPSLQVTSSSATVTLNVVATELKGTVTLNGGPPTNVCTPTPGAYVVFTSGNQTFTAPLSTAFAMDTFVPPGTYEVDVVGDGTCGNLPPGTTDVVAALPVTSSSATVALNVVATELKGTVTLNGGAPTNHCTPTPGAYVVFTSGSETFTAPLTTTFGMDTFVPPGTYEVDVVGDGTCGNLPAGSARVLPSLQVSGSPANLALDVMATELKGTVTRNGGAPTSQCTPTPGAYVVFSSGSQTFTAPLTAAFGIDTFVPPGTYEVSVEADAPCSNLAPGSDELVCALLIP